jgi:deoxyribose-phosphate aldolase
MKGWVKLDINAIIEEVTREVLSGSGESNPSLPVNKNPGEDVADTIEHSILNPDTTAEQIIKACKEAKECRMASVVVSPYYVSLAADYLRGSGIKVCTPIAFPHGAASTAAKVVEAREAIKNGAEELDVSLNILAIKNGDPAEAKKDLEEVINIARGRATVKAIYEQGLYTDEEKVMALNVIKSSGADYVKISNALTGKKALVEDVQFVRGILGDTVAIKIDGGISDAKTVRELMKAGASRFGCSKSVKIIKG